MSVLCRLFGVGDGLAFTRIVITHTHVYRWNPSRQEWILMTRECRRWVLQEWAMHVLCNKKRAHLHTHGFSLSLSLSLSEPCSTIVVVMCN